MGTGSAALGKDSVSFLTADELKAYEKGADGVDSVQTNATGNETTVFMVDLQEYVAMTIVTSERPGALTVPRAAVARLGRAPTVWVARDGLAERREVVTGLENADRVEIRSGLVEGERVVARGREALYAGARVVEAGPATPPDQSGARDDRTGTALPAPAQRAPAKETTHGGH